MNIKHLTTRELAERLDVPEETVRHWRKTGTGPDYMRAGRYVRYREPDVVRWENSRVVASRTA
jgi:excisionase family DNA binding protein